MKSISEKQFLSLMARLPDSVRGRRDRGLYDLMWHAGLRCSEAVGVMPEHYEPRNGEPYLYVLWGKGNKERYVPIGPTLANSIEAWLLSGDRPDVDGPLYPVLRPRKSVDRVTGIEKRKGKPDFQVDTSQLRTTLASLSRESEVYVLTKVPDESREPVNGKPPLKAVRQVIQPHALRHSYAVGLLMQGMATAEIQLNLGHSDLATTESYLKVHDSQRAARTRKAVEGINVDDRVSADLARAKALRHAGGNPDGVAGATETAIRSMIRDLGPDEAMKRLTTDST